ncbi:MAG: cation transporting ATPase C-terminal domain-containing protein, partial [bacterium]
TFFFMLRIFNYSERAFQTGWFLECLITQVLIIFVIRSAKFPFFRSAPSKPLIISAILVVISAVAVTLLPVRAALGFTTLSPAFFGLLFVLVLAYLYLADLLKAYFIRRFKIWN